MDMDGGPPTGSYGQLAAGRMPPQSRAAFEPPCAAEPQPSWRADVAPASYSPWNRVEYSPAIR